MLALFCPAVLPAPTEAPWRLVTDRPDFTESSQAVPHGRTQVEGGVTSSREGGEGSTTLPELLVRVGIAPRWELRLSPPNAQHADGDWGATDSALGFKYEILNDDSAPCLLGIIGQATLPTGDDGFGTDDPELEVKLLWSTPLTDDITLSGNVNGAWRRSEDGSWFEPAVSISAGLGLTDTLGIYAEYYAFLPCDDRAPHDHYVNAGATYQFSPTLQADVRVGTGLNASADDIFMGVGFGILF